MPYADNQGVRIHYQVEGAGPPLVLQHGFTQSIDDWHECEYVDALKGEFRLILVDARGHGASDKPRDTAAYTLERRTADVVSVLDALGIAKAHFWGYSMGGWIGFGIAKHAPERVDRLVIGGAHPFARSQAAWREACRTGLERGGEVFLSMFEQMAGQLPPGYRARLRSVDLEAFLAAVEDRPSLEAGLSTMTMPCCIYAGKADAQCEEVQSAAQQIEHAMFFSLPGLTHLQTFLRADLVLPQVGAFLRAVSPL